MKRYQAQVRLSYYVWVDIETDADSEFAIHDAAIRKAWHEQSKGTGVWGEEPEVLDITEVAEHE